jgi:hypothetical protein
MAGIGFGFRLERGGRAVAVPEAAITSLEVLPAAGLQTVDGADAADANGWVAKIVLPDDGTNAFDPARIVLTVSDPGFAAAGVPGVVTRTVRGGAVLRRQHPNGATLLNSASGGVRTVFVSLDDWVFAGSTIAAAAEPGFYGASQGGAVGTIVNSSTKPYYKPLASWASLQHERRTGAFQPELVVTHLYGMKGQMAAGVRFAGQDEAGGQTGGIDVNAVELSVEQTQGNPFEVFRPTVPIKDLAQGHRCILNARIYPWLGDESAVLDLAVDGIATTGDWSNANPRTPLRFLCDKAGGYSGAVACVKSGAVGGTVQATLAAARGTPFPTLEAAYAALPAWNNSNKGHNDSGGGDIYLVNDTGAPVTFTPGAGITATAGKTWVNVRQDPANTAAASVTFAASRSVPAYTRFLCPVVQTSGNIDANSVWKPLAMEAMTLSISGATSPIHFRQPAFVMRNVTVTGLANANACPLLGSGSAAQKQQLAQAVGVIMEDGSVDAVASGMFSLLGCRFRRVRFEDHARATYPLMDSFDGVQWVATMFRDVRAVSAPTVGANNPIVAGFHAVNFLVEGTMSGGGGAWRLGGDGAVRALDNVLIAYATMPGSGAANPSTNRLNLAYADVAGAVGVSKRVTIRFSIMHQVNIKTDTFLDNTSSTGRTGNWEVRYGVRHEGNVRIEEDAVNVGVGRLRKGFGSGTHTRSRSGLRGAGDSFPPATVCACG